MSGLASAAFILFVLANRYPNWLLRNRISAFLGDISYSLYIIHLPIIYATVLIMRSHEISECTLIPTAFVLAIVGASGLYYAAEAPSIKFGKATLQRIENYKIMNDL